MKTKKEPQEAIKGKHGEKMIEVKVRFWTNDIAENKGEIIPKNGWAYGVVRVEKNDTHGIEPCKPRPFNSLLELPSVIEKVLIEHEITLRPSKKMQKYIKE